MTNLVERLNFNGFNGSENVLHRTRRWTVERNEAAARIAELEGALLTARNDALNEAADATQELARSSDNDVEDAFNDGLTECHDAIEALKAKP
tara:strand:- start:144 stop:422 length:279 start_codon:yes stop_codon:yes gene_type:complete